MYCELYRCKGRVKKRENLYVHWESSYFRDSGSSDGTEVEKTKQLAADNLEECFQQRTMEALSNELTTKLQFLELKNIKTEEIVQGGNVETTEIKASQRS